MEENKQVVAEWKALNQPKLQEIKKANPELYSAVNLALQYLNQKLGGEELPAEVEEVVKTSIQELSVEDAAKKYKLSDFFVSKIKVRNEEEAKKFQELIFALDGGWESSGKFLDALNEKYFYVDRYGFITFGTTEEYFNNEMSKEIFYDDIFSSQTESKQLTFDDLKDIKIFVNTPEKSRKFQELFLSLGGKWSSLDVSDVDKIRKVNYTDKKYLITTDGVMLFYDAPKNFDNSANKEIYYEDIFSSQRPQKPLTKNDLLNKKIVLDTEEKSKKFQLLAYSLGLMWASGENKTPILLNEKYIEISPKGTLSYTSSKDTFNQYTKEEIFYDDIFPGESESTESQTTLETQSATSQSQYKWPIETYPPTLKYPSWNLNFEKNNDDRKSPTQSAGELKRRVNLLGQAVDYTEMILETKFRGNDGNWYEINVGKGGVWTWKKTTPPPTQYSPPSSFASASSSTSFTSTSSAQPTSAPVTNDKPEDLIGREIYFKGSYKIMGIIKVNPKTVRYKISNDKKNIELDIPKNAISSLLQGKVVGKAFLKDPKPAEVVNTTLPSENILDLAAMSNTELKKLYDETYDARKEFSITDPEYLELGEQLVEIANEIDKRNI